MRKGTRALFAVALLIAAGCASGGGTRGAGRPKTPQPSLVPPPADSATVLLWHLDEASGYRLVDAGALHLDGVAGLDTRIDLGHLHGARTFQRTVDSFLYCEFQPQLETPRAMTVEAWIRLDAVGQYEDTPIAMRWNPRLAAQSWVFTVGGLNILPPITTLPSPGDHANLLLTGFQNRATDKLMFSFMPKSAGEPRTVISNSTLDLHRWIHVAATYDGKLACLFINGRLDAQVPVTGEIRASEAPLVCGNAFDTRQLTTISGSLQIGPEYDHNPYYAFQGTIDELRISNVARTAFPYVR